MVRVRFAPSPTGFLHVGGARTLFFNWLYAKRFNGTLVLRIEDTDQARSTREHEKMILSDIEKLNLDYQEGPDKGGQYGPYRQSERLSIYAEHAKHLLKEDKVYYCFCSDELLTQKREAALKMGKTPHYDGTCARLSRKEAETKLAKGEKAGLRFRAAHKNFTLKDHVRGNVEFKEGTVGDFFVTRTPAAHENEIAEGIGMPVYNFCCVIDDYLMKMSHIIRGEDHLSNTARQLMIYDAFGWQVPEFAHTAMVLGSDRQKLSKRSGDVSVHEYLENGYLPEALLNFLILLGWWPPNDFKPKSGHPEILSREELISIFNVDGLQKAAAVFDVQKLKWMNSHYLRHAPISELTERAESFFEQAGINFKSHPKSWYERVVDIFRAESELLSDLPKASEMMFKDSPDVEDAAKTALKEPTAQKVVDALISELQSIGNGELSTTDVEAIQKKVAEKTGLKGKSLFMPMRSIVTGKTHGPELKLIMPVLGRDVVLKRIENIRRTVAK